MTFAAFWLRNFDAAVNLGPRVTLTRAQSDRLIQALVNEPRFLAALKQEMDAARDQRIDAEDAAELARWFKR